MNPGRLNQKIIIYSLETDQDAYGDIIDTKETVHKCWASVKNKSGTEQFKSVTPFAKVITSFLIRYTKKAIDTSMKIEFKGEEYNITYVDNYNFNNKWIEITAEKVM